MQEHQPDWVLNAGAYTAVDKAEAEPELAHAVNAGAPEALPVLWINRGRLSRSAPTSSSTEPKARPINLCRLMSLGVYGASKAAGEAAVQNTLEQGDRA